MIQLKQFLLDIQSQWGREISIKEISETTGVSRATISRLLNDKVTRVDENTVHALCRFFKVPRGEPVPFLIYDPE